MVGQAELGEARHDFGKAGVARHDALRRGEHDSRWRWKAKRKSLLHELRHPSGDLRPQTGIPDSRDEVVDVSHGLHDTGADEGSSSPIGAPSGREGVREGER